MIGNDYYTVTTSCQQTQDKSRRLSRIYNPLPYTMPSYLCVRCQTLVELLLHGESPAPIVNTWRSWHSSWYGVLHHDVFPYVTKIGKSYSATSRHPRKVLQTKYNSVLCALYSVQYRVLRTVFLTLSLTMIMRIP